MNLRKPILLLRPSILWITLFASPALAQTDQYPPLESNDGKTIHAKVLALSADSVLVRRLDGKQFDIPLSRLTPTAQQKLNAYRASQAERRASEAEARNMAGPVALFPDLAVKDSPLSKKFAAAKAKRVEEDLGFFKRPYWPLLLALQSANQLRLDQGGSDAGVSLILLNQGKMPLTLHINESDHLLNAGASDKDVVAGGTCSVSGGSYVNGRLEAYTAGFIIITPFTSPELWVFTQQADAGGILVWNRDVFKP